MPQAENTGDLAPQDHRGITADAVVIVAALKQVTTALKAVQAEVVSLREKAPSPKLLIGGALGAVMIVFGIQAATTLFLISGLLQTRGVDVTIAAEATKKVVAAGAEVGAPVTTTTTTTETVVVPEAPVAVEP